MIKIEYVVQKKDIARDKFHLEEIEEKVEI